MYKVIRPFNDKDGTEYKPGDTYPKRGAKASEERITALRDGKNFYHAAFIVEEVKKK